MDYALDPLDLVKHTARSEKIQTPTINIEVLAQYLEEIAQEAAGLINTDPKQEFLYKNPNGWHLKKLHFLKQKFCHEDEQMKKQVTPVHDCCSSSSSSFAAMTSSSTTSEESNQLEPWCLIKNFEFPLIVRQITEFIETWELSAATKFVVIGLKDTENKSPFGKRHFVEALFSKPTPKCPNPLAVAKVYFHINVSHLLPKDYPVNVTYKFEGYESQFYAMGKHKMTSNKFQRFYIDSILHMKLSFYAELCKCRNPLKTLAERK